MHYQNLLAVTLAFISQIAPAEHFTVQLPRTLGQSASGLKWVELDGKFKIQVPDDFTPGRVSKTITSTPAYYFNARPPRNTSIQVLLLPYQQISQLDDATGRIILPIEFDRTPLKGYFKISRNKYVYYGWSTGDNTLECSMNSPCPLPVPQERRYGTRYLFVIFDKPHDTFIEFTGDFWGPNEQVGGFEGDGRLLRDVIVPSLTPIR
jgi:hypothetical protein